MFASNKEEAGAPTFVPCWGRGIERGMAAAANYCDQPPLGEQIVSQTAVGADGLFQRLFPVFRRWPETCRCRRSWTVNVPDYGDEVDLK